MRIIPWVHEFRSIRIEGYYKVSRVMWDSCPSSWLRVIESENAHAPGVWFALRFPWVQKVAAFRKVEEPAAGDRAVQEAVKHIKVTQAT